MAASSDAIPAGSARAEMQALMGKRARVTVSDGRVVEGELYCIDRDGNIVLRGAETCKREGLPSESSSDKASRWLGIIMVPGAHASKLEVSA
ncbi:hypothetical protein FNF27_01148 [Cafeteria roenbergensis]|uniref:Sm domain-containing protein n=1 Tax=Cafeteria roenbergensis TaxID=33653 RepID=A0A5A8D1V2_CAFRO|nr:hypothetical protein FNF29_00821 [Cafeteria roenbergensis]KAA0158949.1 hypothetical protein FNF31_05119 [Cafeteria roenbergensis]KAA0165161.1 hypothetical protein FNF28_03560 [Cafeteria roenbergensis]KAA0177370.1 hypothetical protein FNF27_01148 [Cafeteria roenbergensis]|eukprot:KAA0156710.1 hypothetical protein FNF29_00821 [Cafeteria roenbergensis]